MLALNELMPMINPAASIGPLRTLFETNAQLLRDVREMREAPERMRAVRERLQAEMNQPAALLPAAEVIEEALPGADRLGEGMEMLGKAFHSFTGASRDWLSGRRAGLEAQLMALEGAVGAFQAAGPIGPAITGSLEAFNKEQSMRQQDLEDRAAADQAAIRGELERIRRLIQQVDVGRI